VSTIPTTIDAYDITVRSNGLRRRRIVEKLFGLVAVLAALLACGILVLVLGTVLDGILWVLRTGAPWKDLPDRYPSYQTCHRRFQQWCRDGTLERVLHALAEDLYQRGGIDLTEAFIDGTFAGAKKGGAASERPSAGRGPRSWQLQTALVFLSPPASQVLHRMRSRSSKRCRAS